MRKKVQVTDLPNYLLESKLKELNHDHFIIDLNDKPELIIMTVDGLAKFYPCKGMKTTIK